MKLFIEALWVFVLFSFLGWLAQFAVKSIKKRRLTNPGFLTLPFLPSVGIGAVLLYIFVLRFENIFMLFFTSAVILTLYKYIFSKLFERSFGFNWKSFSDSKYRLNAYIGLWEPFLYGLSGVLSVKLAFVFMPSLVGVMPMLVALLIPAGISALIIADTVISCVTVVKLRNNLKQMENVSTLLENEDESVSDDELRKDYERRMIESKRFRLRLIKAFPDMESFDYEKHLRRIKEHHKLVMKRNNEVYEKKIKNNEDKPFAYGLSLSKLFWLFFVGSLFGTIIETFWAIIIDGHFEVRVGVVVGPFIPVYGGGAVAITLCLYKLYKKNDVIVFIASAVIGATFEYYCSYFQEVFLGTISWDYSDTLFNIDGRTNLTFALIWGFLGLVWLRYIYPFISKMIEKIPKKPSKIITIILCVLMVLDGILTNAAIYRKNKRAENIPPKTVVGEFCDTVFTDDYMEFIFPHMGNKETFAAEREQKARQSKE
ncbi:MAG: putative ABC transporter permease [Ruminococcus sp.]|nr:putative ABC transporter permease [Ruminococcus sp.]